MNQSVTCPQCGETDVRSIGRDERDNDSIWRCENCGREWWTRSESVSSKGNIWFGGRNSWFRAGGFFASPETSPWANNGDPWGFRRQWGSA